MISSSSAYKLAANQLVTEKAWSGKPFGVLLVFRKCLLGGSWGLLDASWAHLGASWQPLGGLLGSLGALGGLLGALGELLGASRRHLGCFWGGLTGLES